MSLSSLGLTDFEECVYRDLLSGHETTSDGVPAALQRLAALGLVRFDAAGHPVAVEPEIGVSRLIRRRLLETHAQQRRISAAWEAVHLLSARQRGRGRTVTIEQIDGADRVAERIRSLALDAQEVLAMHRSVDLPRPGETTRRRTIVSRKSVLDQAFLDHCRALHRSGDHHRLVDDDGQQLVIVDRAVVFVPSEPGGDSALLISQAGGGGGDGGPVRTRLVTRPGPRTLPRPRAHPRERRVLYLLASTRKDEVAAREMGG
ncbi:hypothetical protein [Nonomuraea salmonea]|uniref:hypothetical protein n=1 Tax=Nonomuraea salmonea TaxID=46181 RepID=UPI002FECD1B7